MYQDHVLALPRNSRSLPCESWKYCFFSFNSMVQIKECHWMVTLDILHGKKISQEKQEHGICSSWFWTCNIMAMRDEASNKESLSNSSWHAKASCIKPINEPTTQSWEGSAWVTIEIPWKVTHWFYPFYMLLTSLINPNMFFSKSCVTFTSNFELKLRSTN